MGRGAVWSGMDGRRPPCEQLREPGWSAFPLTSWERARGCLCGAPARGGPWACPGRVRQGRPTMWLQGLWEQQSQPCGCRRQGNSDRSLGQGRGAVGDVGASCWVPAWPCLTLCEHRCDSEKQDFSPVKLNVTPDSVMPETSSFQVRTNTLYRKLNSPCLLSG